MLFKRPTRYRRDLFIGPKPARRKTVLNVKARLSTKRHLQNKQVVALVSTLLCFIFCALLLWVLGRALFYNNPRYTLRTVRIETGKTITADLVKRKTGLIEGTNMFSVNIRSVREDFMRWFPIVRRMEITRVLPDAVSIKVTERVPIARLGFLWNLYIDEEGCVFGQGQQARIRNLPIITGSNVESFKPGHRLEGPALAALQLLNVCSIDDEMRIESVELKGPKQVDLRVIYDNVVWNGRLAWNDMGKPTLAAETQLAEKLAKMRTVFKTYPNNQAGTFDARGSEVYVQ